MRQRGCESTHACLRFLPPQSENLGALQASTEGTLVSVHLWGSSAIKRVSLLGRPCVWMSRPVGE